MTRVVAVLCLFAAAACGPAPLTPQQACRDDAPVTCEKMWTCDATVKIGDDQASCVTQTQSLCSLASSCEAGKTFNPTKATDCTSKKKAQTCAEWKAGEPAECSQICT